MQDTIPTIKASNQPKKGSEYYIQRKKEVGDPLDLELTRIKAVIEQRDILKKELEDGYRPALKSFFIYLVQAGMTTEGYNPDHVVEDYLRRDDNSQDNCPYGYTPRGD